MEGEMYQFTVNTSNICLLCLNNHNNSKRGRRKQTFTSVSNIKTFSLRNIFLHLKIEPSRIKSLSKKSPSELDRTDVRASLCEECGKVVDHFSEHYEAMELSRRRMTSTLEIIQGRVSESKESPRLMEEYHRRIEESSEVLAKKHCKVVKGIREEILAKSGMKINKSNPPLTLEDPSDQNLSSGEDHEEDEEQDNCDPDIKIESVESDTDYDDEDLSHLLDDHDRLDFEESAATQTKTSTSNTVKKPTGGKRICSICSKTFRCKEYYDIHMRTHTGERPFGCPKCSKSFTSKRAVTSHVKSVHEFPMIRSQKNEKTCGKIKIIAEKVIKSNSSQQRQSQQKIKKIRNSIKYECPHCGRLCQGNNHLTQHLRIHSGERPYKCKFCPKAFNHPTSLQRHSYIHTGEKLYQCEHCKKRFNDKSNFTKHVRAHIMKKDGK